MSTVAMTPPASGAQSISFNGRTYSSSPGIFIPVLSFDVPILEANGWTRQSVTSSLQTLTLSASSFPAGEPQGTFISNISGTMAGSALTISNVIPSGAVQISQVSGTWQLQVGAIPPSSPTTITFSLTETLSNVTNLSVSEISSGPSSYQLTFPENSYVGLSSAANTALAWDRTQPWSCMAGINLSSPPGISGAIGGLIFSNAGASPFPCYEFWITSSTQTNPGCLVVRLINNYTSNQIYVVGSIYVCDGCYHMVACSYDGSSSASGVKMYVDGIQDTNLTILNDNLTASIVGVTNPFYIGNQSGSSLSTYAFVGSINFFALSNAARSSSYFASYPWAGAPPAVDSNNVLYFNLSEGGGTTLHDQSFNAFNGTLSGTALPAWGSGPPAAAPSPTNSTTPSITGTPQVGQVLTVSKGTWANAIKFTYQWYWADTGAAISGAINSIYTAQSSDIGHTLAVKVTGTGAGGSLTVASSTTSVIMSASTGVTLQSSVKNQTLNGSSISATISTAGNNCMIYVSCITNSGTAPAISDTTGLTWNARVIMHPSGGYQYSWYAIAASPVTNGTVTVSGSAGVVYNITALVWSKGGTTPSLPQPPVTVTGASSVAQISTTQTAGVLFGDYWFGSTANPSAGSGFTQITTATYELAEYQPFSAAFSNVNVTIGTGSGTHNCGYSEVIV